MKLLWRRFVPSVVALFVVTAAPPATAADAPTVRIKSSSRAEVLSVRNIALTLESERATRLVLRATVTVGKHRAVATRQTAVRLKAGKRAQVRLALTRRGRKLLRDCRRPNALKLRISTRRDRGRYAVVARRTLRCPAANPALIDQPPSLGVDGMTQLDRLPVLGNPAQSLMASSHARDGTNLDNMPFLQRDAQDRFVLMDAEGPGAVNRVWMTGPATQQSGDTTPYGRIMFFIDGEQTPRIDLAVPDFFKGDLPELPAPLCHDHHVSSGGNYCDLRIPFAKSMRVVTTGAPGYYDIGYETFAVDANVTSFDPADASTRATLKSAAEMWKRSGEDPRILPPGRTHTGTTTAAAGSRARLLRLNHAGTLREVRLGLDAHDDETLRSVRLQIRWDGQRRPAVDAPLADLFLTGAGERLEVKALLAGYAPDRHEGYLRFPMPFASSADLRLVNPTGHAVTATWSVQESNARYADIGGRTGRLHATFNHDPETDFGRDYTVFRAEGAGKVVGVSFTERGDSVNDGTTTYMEGDERIHVDGSRSPAIYGTGTEDFFSGAYYYPTLFSLPDHGANAEDQITPKLGQTAQYRLLLADPWEFRNGIDFGMEHAGGNGQITDARSVTFWYATDKRKPRETDAFDVHARGADYQADDPIPTTLTSYFEGDRDGNVSAPPDWILGSFPPNEADPMGESETFTGYFHADGSSIRFSIAVDPTNEGVLLRRLLDQGTFGQRAEVLVDGAPAGVWFTPGDNQTKRWAESDFWLPASLTRGKDRLAITIRVRAPRDAPSNERVGWTDFRYVALSLLP